MAFSYEVYPQVGHTGPFRVVLGEYANAGGTTGGDIVTGLQETLAVVLTPSAAAVTSQHVVNETFPLASGSFTIVTGANEGGQFVAIGI